MNKKFFTAVSFACAMAAVLICTTFGGCSNENVETSLNSNIQTTQAITQADTTSQSENEESHSISDVKNEEISDEKTTEENSNADLEKKNEESDNEKDNKEKDNKEESKGNSNNSDDLKVKEVSFSDSSISMDKGSDKTIRIYYSPSNATDMSYSVNTDSDCVSIECSGTEIYVHAEKGGSCKLTLTTVSGLSASCNIEVKEEEKEFVDESYDNPYQEYADRILSIVNEERTSRGLSKLSLRNDITKIANRRAVEISENYSHECPDGTYIWNVLVGSGVTRAASENIAYGQPTPDDVMEAWMNSEAHRGSILSTQYNYIGVGYYEKDGVPYWVQVFIK